MQGSNKNKNLNKWNSTIKQAMDYLPDGIAFFSADDLLILSNHSMNDLAQKLMGTDLQLLSELTESILNPDGKRAVVMKEFGNALKFADGNVWRFTTSVITDESGRPITQIVAYNLNEQYLLYEELQNRNRELLEMQERLSRVRLRVADSVREQEILAAKMQVHNKMGSCMFLLRHYLKGDHSDGEKEQMLKYFRLMTGELKQEIGQADESSSLNDIVRIAGNLGLKVEFKGEIPPGSVIDTCLSLALKECVTNTLRHAKGTVLTVTVKENLDMVEAKFVDNGTLPDPRITLGGGLSSLKERLARTGAAMEVRTDPGFMLILRIPKVAKMERI